jgi:hypothetical protein
MAVDTGVVEAQKTQIAMRVTIRQFTSPGRTLGRIGGESNIEADGVLIVAAIRFGPAAPTLAPSPDLRQRRPESRGGKAQLGFLNLRLCGNCLRPGRIRAVTLDSSLLDGVQAVLTMSPVGHRSRDA